MIKLDKPSTTLNIHLRIIAELDPYLSNESAEEKIKKVISDCDLSEKIIGVLVVKQKGPVGSDQYVVRSADYPIGNIDTDPISNIGKLIGKVSGYMKRNPRAILLITDVPNLESKFKPPEYDVKNLSAP